jgi:flagellar hook-associated protein 3 FlgL
MRVSFSQTYGKLSLSIGQQQESIDQLSTMIATGRKINTQQDDPLGWARSVNYTQAVRQIQSCEKNIDFASGWNDVTNQALTALAGGSSSGGTDFLSQALNIGAQAKTADAQTRQTLANTVDNIIRQTVDIANTKNADSYVFSGQDTSTKPFSSTDGVNGWVSAVTPNSSNDSTFEVRVGMNSSETVNITGAAAFNDNTPLANGTTPSLFKSLMDLRDAIASNDSTGIDTAISAIQTNRQNIVNQMTTVGFRQADLSNKKSMLSSLETTNENQVSNITQADMAATITQLNQTQIIYQAALQVTAKVTGMNLTQYL